MKKYLILFGVLLVFGFAGSHLFTAEIAGDDEGSDDIAVVGVDELMESPNDFDGPVQVEGVVSGVSDIDDKLTLIDLEEYELCKDVTCAALMLPVNWEGEMPDVEDEVVVFGEIRETDEGLIFAALEIEVIQKEKSEESQVE